MDADKSLKIKKVAMSAAFFMVSLFIVLFSAKVTYAENNNPKVRTFEETTSLWSQVILYPVSATEASTFESYHYNQEGSGYNQIKLNSNCYRENLRSVNQKPDQLLNRMLKAL